MFCYGTEQNKIVVGQGYLEALLTSPQRNCRRLRGRSDQDPLEGNWGLGKGTGERLPTIILRDWGKEQVGVLDQVSEQLKTTSTMTGCPPDLLILLLIKFLASLPAMVLC